MTRRVLIALSMTGAAVLGGTASIAWTAAASAAPTRTCADDSQPGAGNVDSTASSQDIDADGYSDLLVGVPTASAAGKASVGVHYAVGASITAPSPQRVGAAYFGFPSAAGDRFGASTAITDLDEQHCEDVVVGAPGSNGGRGAVILAYGSVDGLSPSGAVRLSGRAAGENFGAAVAAVGRDVWVAAPNRAVRGQLAAGAVDHYRVTDGTAALVETITQGAGGVGGTAEAGDHFGQALSAGHDLSVAIAAPDESIGSVRRAGMVTVVRTSATTHRVTSSQAVNQNTPGVGGGAETNDRFGASVSLGRTDRPAVELAVGAPGESIGTVSGAGLVQVLGLPATGAVRQHAALTQSTPTVSGGPEAGDQFGAGLLMGSFTGWTTDDLESGSATGDYELAIGVPGEDIGSTADAGIVTVVLVDAREDGSTAYVQKVGNIQRGGSSQYALDGTPTAGDRVGAGLSAVGLEQQSLNDGFDTFLSGGAALVVATPGDDQGAADSGSMTVLGRDAIDRKQKVVVRDSTGPTSGERYGVGASTPATSIQESSNSG